MRQEIIGGYEAGMWQIDLCCRIILPVITSGGGGDQTWTWKEAGKGYYSGAGNSWWTTEHCFKNLTLVNNGSPSFSVPSSAVPDRDTLVRALAYPSRTQSLSLTVASFHRITGESCPPAGAAHIPNEGHCVLQGHPRPPLRLYCGCPIAVFPSAPVAPLPHACYPSEHTPDHLHADAHCRT